MLALRFEFPGSFILSVEQVTSTIATPLHSSRETERQTETHTDRAREGRGRKRVLFALALGCDDP